MREEAVPRCVRLNRVLNDRRELLDANDLPTLRVVGRSFMSLFGGDHAVRRVCADAPASPSRFARSTPIGRRA